jgi:hypothetical protein
VLLALLVLAVGLLGLGNVHLHDKKPHSVYKKEQFDGKGGNRSANHRVSINQSTELK